MNVLARHVSIANQERRGCQASDATANDVGFAVGDVWRLFTEHAIPPTAHSLGNVRGQSYGLYPSEVLVVVSWSFLWVAVNLTGAPNVSSP
jgi:hypothetical protein